MSNSFNNINLPGLSSNKKEEEPKKKTVTGVEDSNDTEEKPESEVRLISAEWKGGPTGFQYNEQCFVDVKTEYLKKTIRKRIKGHLFAIYNDKEEDLAQEIEGFIDDETNTARLNIKNLWYVDLEHRKACLKDPSIKAQYLVKNISHSRGANTIDSPKLDMPATPYHSRGGFCLRICFDPYVTIKGATLTVKAENDEIFSSIVEDGILEFTAVYASKITVSSEYEGQSASNVIQWIAGEPPYPEQIIIIPSNNEK
jgi:hypothetical protein